MKALFGRNRKPVYPDHHYPEHAHPYYPPKNTTRGDDSMPSLTSDYRSAQSVSAIRQPTAKSRLTTLEALQIIRRRFEESQDITYEDRAA